MESSTSIPPIMDSKIVGLEENLTDEFKKYFQATNKMNFLKKNCKNTIKSTFILTKIIVQKVHRKSIITKYEALLNLLKNPKTNENNREIEANINSINQDMIYTIGVIVQAKVEAIQTFYQEAFNQFSKFTEILAYFMAKIIEEYLSDRNYFMDAWEIYLKNLLMTLNLVSNNSNLFAKSIFFNILTQKTVDDLYNGMIVLEKIAELTRYIFGKISNLKFFIKASKIYEYCLTQRQFSAKSSRENEDSSLLFCCSRVPTNSYPQSQSTKTVYDKSLFKLTNAGHEDSRRKDRITFFGNHPHCDVCFPKSVSEIEEISFVVFYDLKNYLILDCGQKSCLKKKMEPYKECRLKPSKMIELAEKALMHIVDVKHQTDETTGMITGIIYYEFLTGELSVALGGRVKAIYSPPILSSPDSPPKYEKFLVGRGGGGDTAKILFIREKRISSLHMYLNYDKEAWWAYDARSTWGSFKLYKNYSQLVNEYYSDFYYLLPKANKKISDELPEAKEPRSTTITIAGFSFFITEQLQDN